MLRVYLINKHMTCGKNDFNKQQINILYTGFLKADKSKQLLSPVITTGGHNHTKNRCFEYFLVAEVNLKGEFIS